MANHPLTGAARRLPFAWMDTPAAPPPLSPPRGNPALAKTVIISAAGLGLLTWVGVLIASIRKSPGIDGWMGGIFVGLFAGLGVMLGGAALAVRLAAPPGPRPAPAVNTALGDQLATQLSDVLAQLEISRQATVARINQRAAWRVPLCAAAGLAIWIKSQFSDDPGDIVAFFSLLIVPGMMGYMWASLALSNSYAKLYKTAVLPRLAASFGEISYRPAILPDLATLKAERIFREYDTADADDELFGKHRGLAIDIVELKLEKKSGKNSTTIFDGLIVEIELPRDSGAVTAIIADGGSFGNLRDRMMANGRQRVALEDPVFERIYEVYGTDQIAARTLLHPAFMERLLKLGERPGYGRPLVLATGKRLIFALPKTTSRNLFEAPSFQMPAASREVLIQLYDDIAAVLAAADAVIDLDFHFTAGRGV